MTFDVAVSERAWSDADRIFEWIAKRSPQGAIKWNQAFVHALLQLKREASQHALAPESAELAETIRQYLFKTRRGQSYRLVYTIVGTRVEVLRVRGPGQSAVTSDDFT